MATHYMLPPSGRGSVTTAVYGRSYTAAPGSFVIADGPSHADMLEANGWTRASRNSSGTTALRPVLTKLQAGFAYLDTTLGKVISWDGATWRNPVDGSSV